MSDCRRSVRFAVSSCAGEQQQAGTQNNGAGLLWQVIEWVQRGREEREGGNGATFSVWGTWGLGGVHVQVQKEKKVVENCMEWSKI